MHNQGQLDDDAYVATRRMCAGAYLDREFRRRILRDIYADRVRRVCPSYGFDLIPVIRHAWRAWSLDALRHVLLAALLVLSFVFSPTSALTVVGALLLYYVVPALGRLVADAWAYLRHRKGVPGEAAQLRYRARYVFYQVLGCALLISAAGLSLLGGEGGRAAFALDLGRRVLPWPVRGTLLDALLIVAGLLAINVVVAVGRQAAFQQLRNEESLEPVIPSRRMHAIDLQQFHAFSVYGDNEPFLGSGDNIITWSFAQRLIHAKDDPDEPDRPFSKPPFSTRKLIRTLGARIQALERSRHPETRLRNLKVHDRILLDGIHAAKFRTDLDRPASKATLRSIMADPSGVARHQLGCRVKSWGGEVVTTVFVHVSLQGNTLYIEFSTYALTPTRPEFHLIDEVRGTGPGAFARAIAQSVVATPPESLLAIPRLGEDCLDLLAAARVVLGDEGPVRRGANTGALVSARELATSDDERTYLRTSLRERGYFQYRDVIKFSKIIERQLIATTGDFLAKYKVDTSEFWQRAVAILNQGVVNNGTMINLNSAIGAQPVVTNEAAVP